MVIQLDCQNTKLRSLSAPRKKKQKRKESEEKEEELKTKKELSYIA